MCIGNGLFRFNATVLVLIYLAAGEAADTFGQEIFRGCEAICSLARNRGCCCFTVFLEAVRAGPLCLHPRTTGIEASSIAWLGLLQASLKPSMLLWGLTEVVDNATRELSSSQISVKDEHHNHTGPRPCPCRALPCDPWIYCRWRHWLRLVSTCARPIKSSLLENMICAL